MSSRLFSGIPAAGKRRNRLVLLLCTPEDIPGMRVRCPQMLRARRARAIRGQRRHRVIRIVPRRPELVVASARRRSLLHNVSASVSVDRIAGRTSGSSPVVTVTVLGPAMMCEFWRTPGKRRLAK